MGDDLDLYLCSTPAIESEHPAVLEFVGRHAAQAAGQVDQAVKLFYAVRDGIRYDPYIIDLSLDALKASRTLASGRGWCVSKAILLAACCRSLSIPSRLGYADVRNHLSTARMREIMRTDIFYWHGYTSMYLADHWVKATPAFNIELCEKFGFHALDFDGKHDALYHPFDMEGRRHMEYLNYRGEFADVPVEAIIATFTEKYLAPRMTDPDADFDRDVDSETSGA